MNSQEVKDFLYDLVVQDARRLKDKIVDQCPKCKGSGLVIHPQTFKIKGPCSCRAEFSYRLRLLTGNIRESLWADRKVDPKQVTELTEFPDKNTKAFDLHKKYVDLYCSRARKVVAEGYSFVFMGQHDTGKTFTLFHILRQFARAGYQPYYITMRQLVLHFNRLFTDEKSKDFVEAIRNVDLLGIDELGKESSVSRHFIGELEDMIKHRMAISRPTLFISNRRPEEFATEYGENIVNAMIENYRILIFPDAVSFRRRYRKEWDL